MLGTLAHLGFDALLISAFLAGIKRTTGLTLHSLKFPTKTSAKCCGHTSNSENMYLTLRWSYSGGRPHSRDSD
ncbi:hypothetical protein BD779DRAFT_1489116, partial [Infundibulicybe gibba]